MPSKVEEESLDDHHDAAAAEPAPPAAVARPAAPRPRPTGPVATALGIDFGTTYSSASVAIGDRVHLVTDAEGRAIQPSIVHYPERGGPIVGWAARDHLITDPRRTVASVKRLLGRRHSDPTIGGYLTSLSVKTAAGPGDGVLIDLGNEEHYAAAQVAAHVIAHVRDLAEAQTGARFTKAALSHPVTFGDHERAALRRAAQLAGLDVVAFVEEPVAGAMAYGLGKEKNEIVAVYDFGGGTFDFTVLDISNERFRVLASEGESWLGGDDFDLALAQAVADAFWRATKIELRQRLVEWQRLLVACEAAKRELSASPSARIIVDGLVEAPKKIDLRQRLDRSVFERLCRPLFDRSVTVLEAALARAGLEPRDVTQLVVTGGVSSVPFVRAGLARVFDREVESVVPPQEAICLGTGLVAAQSVQHEVMGTVFSS
jgi:molecular chaperone DnaK